MSNNTLFAIKIDALQSKREKIAEKDDGN